MQTASSDRSSQASPLHRIAQVSSVIGGGVVGVDYATWFEVDPFVGMLMGVGISWALTTLLLKLRAAKKEIAKACGLIGGLLGCLSGAYLGYKFGIAEYADVPAMYGLGGFLVGGLIGSIAGQMIAALISFSVFALLGISQGPVGAVLRGVLMKQNDVQEDLGSALEAVFASLPIHVDASLQVLC